MRPARTLRTLLTAGALLAAAANTALAVDSKDNAALAYWRVFSLVDADGADAVNTTGRDALGADGIANLDHSVLDVIRDDALIRRLIQAASLPECDFAVEYERGIEALLPHLGPMRTGVTALLLRAQLDLAEGDPAHAAQCLAAALRSAEHIIGDRILISSLVSAWMIERARPIVEAASARDDFGEEQRLVVLDAIERFEARDPVGAVAALRTEARMIARWAEANLRGDEGISILTRVSPGVTHDEADRFLNDAPNQIRLYTLAMDNAIDAVAARDLDALRALGEALHNGVFGEMAKVLVPSHGRTITAMDQAESSLRSMRATLAR